MRFTAGLNADIYARTPLVYSAVERKFEIIGEALNQLAKVRPDLARAFRTCRRLWRSETS